MPHPLKERTTREKEPHDDEFRSQCTMKGSFCSFFARLTGTLVEIILSCYSHTLENK